MANIENPRCVIGKNDIQSSQLNQTAANQELTFDIQTTELIEALNKGT